ncbi:MAG TPA: acetate--CoA ligase family protein [Thermoleophilaceae bacterium]
MDLTRLLHPRAVAVVGATERDGSYGGQTVLNLAIAGFRGEVWPVNPRRERVYDLPCYPSLADLPAPADAVVVSVPAPAVPELVDEAGAVGCGGAVVIGAGFGEVASGRALEAELAAAANRHGLPVCGPNCNGIVGLHDGVALWGDALNPLEPGEVALVSQSGNVAVNALATSRGLRLHTVVSCGNQAVLEAADWLEALAREEGVRSVALYLEADGDGARLCEALARCAEEGVRVAVLKVGSSAAGAAAASAHTGAVAGDHRVFRALVEEAGAAWARDVHELLELAKALAVERPARPPDGGLAVLTCSGGDSSLAADEAERLGMELPPLAAETRARLRALLPEAATVGNPLDYTALIWGETELLRDIVAAVGRDQAIDRMLVLYDQPVGITGAPAESWEAVLDGILAGAAASPAPTMVASTLPELLDDRSARRMAEAGVPAIAGLRTGLRVARELARPPADPVRLREIGAAAGRRPAAGDGWLAEHEAKELLRSVGLPVVDGRVADSEDDAAAALAEIGGPVALKLSAPSLRHKSEAGALALGLAAEDELRAAHRRLSALPVDGASMLVERMAAPGAELLVAARADAVVPALVIGLGGIWVEVMDDLAVVPLPAAPERVLWALHGLRGAALLTGGRGRPALDVAAAASVAAAAGELLLERGLALIELNPVLVYESGAVVVDAAARA